MKKFLGNFSFICLLSLYGTGSDLRAEDPYEAFQQEKEIDHLRHQILSLPESISADNPYKLATYALAGSAVTAYIASANGILESKGPWFCSFVVGLIAGTGCYIFTEIPRYWIFRKTSVLQHLIEILDEAPSKELFEKLLFTTTRVFLLLSTSHRLHTSFEMHYYFKFLERLLLFYEQNPNYDFEIFHIAAQSLQHFYPSSISFKRRLSELKYKFYGYYGSQIRSRRFENTGAKAESLGLSLEEFRTYAESYQQTRSFLRKFEPHQIEVYELPEIETSSWRLDLGDGKLRLGSKVLRSAVESLAEVQRLDRTGEGYWVRYPSLGQQEWSFYYKDQALPHSSETDLGPIEIAQNLFENPKLQLIDIQPRPQSLAGIDHAFVHRTKQKIREKIGYGKVICASLLSGFQN